ncbi:MAG: DUF1015 domain-containing protein [Actinomycetes bacterium]
MIRATTPVDRLDRDGRTLLLYERSVVELHPLGLAAFEASADGIDMDALTHRLVTTFGAPPEGAVADIVARIVADLVQRGVLVLELDDEASEPKRGSMPRLDCVHVPRVLLPTAEVDASRWAVIACDQFTSQPDYWDEVEHTVGDAPSTLRMVLPELHLNAPDVAERIAGCQHAMREYLSAGLLEPHDAFVYVERGVTHGVQRGLVVALDLEAYDFSAASTSLVRSTEGTVLDRLPPRMAVRREAALELPHILVLYDDPDHTVLADVLTRRDDLPVAYDVELMAGSGRLTGRFVADPALQASVLDSLAALIEPDAYRARYGLDADAPILFAMGDGNHSLATAKGIWDELRAAGARPDHPARHALVELVNLHEASVRFEPIHRVVFGAGSLASDLPAALGAEVTPMTGLAEVLDAIATPSASQRFGLVSSESYALVEVPEPSHQLVVGTVQDHLDAWIALHPHASLDYLHGEDATDAIARRPGNLGVLLPGLSKDAFFRSIAVDGPLPRKTFSMGHARDKRFYMECRAIR